MPSEAGTTMVKNNRNKGGCTTELQVDGKIYKGEEVIVGFNQHFSKLANTTMTSKSTNYNYHQNVEYEIDLIQQLVNCRQIPNATFQEIQDAIKSMNKGKSADIFGITIEHFIHGGKKLEVLLLNTINLMFKKGLVPDLLKAGLLSPVFKNKGNKNVSNNYRGITVLPVVNKIVEAVIKVRIQPAVINIQNPVQRGFTANSAPMNAALPIEEVYRESDDTKQEYELVLLDAKSAFDVVIHSHVLRRLYHAGIEDKHWTIINSMHTNATSAVKWEGQISSKFEVTQGVRQGGILSTDLYKLYINPLLDRLEQSGLGCKIGNVLCNVTACADDVALISQKATDMQSQINMSNDFAEMEGYKLQPQKSVAIRIKPSSTRKISERHQYTLGDGIMPNVEKAVHLGVIRTSSAKQNVEENVQENITKARRSAYALFGCGFHGENGLDPETTIHLFKTYITPVLMYGMELLTPRDAQLDSLEKFQKKMVKQLLSLPMNTPDPAVYILSGLLPIEAQLHTKVLTFYNNICQQSEESLEKRLARRQLHVKSTNSSSWFIDVQRIILKYNLGDAREWLDDKTKKTKKNNSIKNEINKYWAEKISIDASLYNSLKYLNTNVTKLGKVHRLLRVKCQSAGDVQRIPTKLRLMTGTYILQPMRHRIFREGPETACAACGESEETATHLLLECEAWHISRQSALNQIRQLWDKQSQIKWDDIDSITRTKILIDITVFKNDHQLSDDNIDSIEYHIRRLIFNVHQARNKVILKK